MSNGLKTLLIVFVLINTVLLSGMFTIGWQNDSEIKFSDVEMQVIKNCNYNRLVLIGKTNKRNYKRIHKLIDETVCTFFTKIERKFLEAQSVQQKLTILENGLNRIKEKYIQKKKTVYRNFFNTNPNISVLKISVNYINDCIQKELDNDIGSYSKRRYATMFWNFLEPIKKSPYISIDDKKQIFKLINKKVKNLKVSCLLPEAPNKTIKSLLRPKRKFENCIIF